MKLELDTNELMFVWQALARVADSLWADWQVAMDKGDDDAADRRAENAREAERIARLVYGAIPRTERIVSSSGPKRGK